VSPPQWAGRHRVSIIIPSHREEFTAQAMASAYAQGPEHQVIYWHSRQNWPSKINEAVRASEGEFFVLHPEDDLLDPTFVPRCLEHADSADVVMTDRRVFNDGTEPTQGAREFLFGEQYQGERYYTVKPPIGYFEFGVRFPATFLCRRSWWDSLGGLDETMSHADTEWHFRSALAGARTQYIPEPLLFYRRHAAQYGKLHPGSRDFLNHFHRKHFPIFGLDFDRVREITPTQLYIEPIPVEQRAAYAAERGWKSRPIPARHGLEGERAREALSDAAKAFVSQILAQCDEDPRADAALVAAYKAWDSALVAIQVRTARSVAA
jgi:hypothetical protein